MKPGDFRYEPLLKYKAFIEEEKMYELAGATEKLDMEEKRLFSLEEIQRCAVEELIERQAVDVSPHEILMYQTYLYHIDLEIETQRMKVLETQRLYDEKRASLIIATQDRKIVEKVKENDKAKMMESEKRADKKALDETGTSRYVRENC